MHFNTLKKIPLSNLMLIHSRNQTIYSMNAMGHAIIIARYIQEGLLQLYVKALVTKRTGYIFRIYTTFTEYLI